VGSTTKFLQLDRKSSSSDGWYLAEEANGNCYEKGFDLISGRDDLQN
jgi:hypothetical protein